MFDFFKHIGKPLQRESKLPISLYRKIADAVLKYSIVASGQCLMTAEKASLYKLNAVTQDALLNEIVAFHIKIAITCVMVKQHLTGKENYDQIEALICNSIENILTQPNQNLTQYLPIISKENRERTRMYFLRGSHGLEVSDEQIRAYAVKHNRREILTDIPVDQKSLIYFVVRIARLLEVGRDVDLAIVHFVNDMLVHRIKELRNEVCNYFE